ncbi:MAG TPA: response regulator [Candidatus Hydrogenedentes bacterium]|nr:response regulator [Candidatus Hydrogenedentota bacterium]HPG68598.1 response regulator [Candidatus Hydrogenedentota bacterium]
MTTDEKKRILIVDDDPDILFQFRVQFEAAGFEVVETDSADKARQLLATASVDLAVVDLMMEQLDAGFTLCYAIKKAWPNMPVIIVTGVAAETGMDFDAATHEERSWIKADVVLAKPVRFEQLLGEVRRLL